MGNIIGPVTRQTKTRSFSLSSNVKAKGTMVSSRWISVLLLLVAALVPPVARSEVVQLTDATFEHLTQASTGSTTGKWLVKVRETTYVIARSQQLYPLDFGILYSKALRIR
jgi:hypothetical protein